jgi:heterotetrameric sarcosine oxidase gamma subunit
VREHTPSLLASMIARPGQTTTLSAATERAFGVPLPLTPRVASGAGVNFIWSGPGHWLVESSSAAVSMDGLLTIVAGLAYIFEQTDSRVVLEVSGPRVRDVLAKGLPIDLHPASFQVSCVALTSASHIGVQLWQMAADPVYRIAVARSFFASFWHWLASSASEYGCEIINPG